MRVLLAIGLLVLVVCSVACADDAIPTFAEPTAPTESQSTQRSEPPSAQAQPEQPAAAESVRNANLLMRLEADLNVYQFIGGDWLPSHTYGSRTLLLADGWTRDERGVLWLHLDLNGDLDGWARQRQSPLSEAEALSLPEMSEPSLPTTRFTAPNGKAFSVALLGKTADSTGIVVRFAGSEAALRVDRWLIDDSYRFDWLPTYTGSVAGRWEPWRGDQTGDLTVQVYSYGANVAAWPSGPPLAWRLQSDRYPVLGRSLDDDWLALRVDVLDPPVVWLKIGPRELDFDPTELPIFLSLGLELIELDADGRAVASMFAPRQPSYWEWRSDRELLLGERDAGTWLWNVERNESHKVSERLLANVSPNGAFAVDVFHPDPSVEEWWHEPSDTALVSLEDGSEVVFEAVHKPWGTDAPGFQQFWSADSQWLLSTVFRYGDEDEATRLFALSRLGERVEVVPPEDEWASHWNDLRSIKESGGAVRYLNADGEEIARPWTDAAYPPGWEAAEPPPELPDGWWGRDWSLGGRWILAVRSRLANEFDESGLAALPWTGRRAWGIYEVGVFDRDGTLLQVFRGFGLECGLRTSTAQWSPDGTRILFGPRALGCA
ncbi:MAG: hypothetical protein OXS30_05850 [Chloroflexota bacterium]|nr:hypothetical protein [Chloroflexota bacterium]